jgi:hypothetical protein
MPRATIIALIVSAEVEDKKLGVEMRRIRMPRPPRPPKPPDYPQPPRSPMAPGKHEWVKSHWRYNYGTGKWEWVDGHWRK